MLMFENKGEVVGVSNPHPHCQIYATNFVFKTMEIEAEASAEHLAEHGRPLFHDIIAAEEADGRRLLVDKERALSFVPYFRALSLRDVRCSARDAGQHRRPRRRRAGRVLPKCFGETLVRLENLWQMPLPHVMVLHQAPTQDPSPGFHFHIQILPPLRKPGLLKYLAGPEVGAGNFLNDTAPEAKAAELQAVSATHYKHGGDDV